LVKSRLLSLLYLTAREGSREYAMWSWLQPLSEGRRGREGGEDRRTGRETRCVSRAAGAGRGRAHDSKTPSSCVCVCVVQVGVCQGDPTLDVQRRHCSRKPEQQAGCPWRAWAGWVRMCMGLRGEASRG
jgi:hypothetical protein